MALKIVRASEAIEVKQIVVTVYAPPGVGKTSLAFTADAPLLLDFDKGAYRSANRGDSVQPASWADVSSIAPADMATFKTLVFDTTGRALDMLSVALIAENPKNGRGGGSLSLPGYGELKTRFTNYLTLVRSFGLDVVLLVHMDEQRRGDDLIERLDMQGASKNEVYKCADLMGRLRAKKAGRGDVLDFSPSDTAFGKNPAGFPLLDVPDFAQNCHFLADLIAQTKAALNKQTEAQTKAAGELAEWQAKFEKAANAKELNAFIPLLADAGDNPKRLFLKVGQAKQFEWDKTAKAFKEPVPAAPAAEPEQDEIDWPDAVPA